MSDYVSVSSIKLKNAILTPKVIEAYRAGILSFDQINNVTSPLKEIYKDTYQFLTFPVPNEEINKLIDKANNSKVPILSSQRLIYLPANDPRNMS